MTLLLDTHTLLWVLFDRPELAATARAAIEDPENVVLVSVISAWEIAIKRALGRLEAPDDLSQVIETAGFIPRLVTFEDVNRVATLPLHHRDPFDRMLVAQALQDGVPLVSRDRNIARYQVQLVW